MSFELSGAWLGKWFTISRFSSLWHWVTQLHILVPIGCQLKFPVWEGWGWQQKEDTLNNLVGFRVLEQHMLNFLFGAMQTKLLLLMVLWVGPSSLGSHGVYDLSVVFLLNSIIINLFMCMHILWSSLGPLYPKSQFQIHALQAELPSVRSTREIFHIPEQICTYNQCFISDKFLSFFQPKEEKWKLLFFLV
jgi:hypothetical protein